MNKIMTIGITVITALSLVGCAPNKSGSDSSSSSSSSVKKAKYITPSENDFKKATSIDNKLGTKFSPKRVNTEQKDDTVRFSDITKTQHKYAGTAKIVTGQVFQMEKSTVIKGFKDIYLADNANPDHVWILVSRKTGIRKDDTLIINGTVVGEYTYPNNNNKIVKAVMIMAYKTNIQNNGATGK